MKIAIAGLAGVGAAWMIPKGGGAPPVAPSVTPSDRPGVTAVSATLASIPQGVSFRILDDVRVFLVRTGNGLVGLHGVQTSEGNGPIWWCPKNHWFEGSGPGPFHSSRGVVLRYSAPRNLDQIHVQVTGGSVTIFPHTIIRGGAAPPTPAPPPPLPAPPPLCSAAERVG